MGKLSYETMLRHLNCQGYDLVAVPRRPTCIPYYTYTPCYTYYPQYTYKYSYPTYRPYSYGGFSY